MKILFIASRRPYPPLRGDQVRAYHFLKQLNPRHEITLITPAEGPKDAAVEKELGFLCRRWVDLPVGRFEFIRNLLGRGGLRLPLQVLYFCPAALRETVERLLREENFDLVHLQLARTGPALEALGGVPAVLDYIDALSLNMRRRAELERRPLGVLFRWEAQKMLRYERELAGRTSGQLITSAADRAAIGPYRTLQVVPNGIDPDAYPWREEGREEKLVVFSGNMGYAPNVEAAVFLAEKVWPLVRSGEPTARLQLVGANPARRVERLAAGAGIEVTGFVSNMVDYLGRAAVAAAPMLSGTGIQNKILEAMACGAPVVATSRVLAGLERAIPGEHLLVADEPQALAGQVLRLLGDPSLRRTMARAARSLVEREYSWAGAASRLEAVYRAALGEGL